MNEKNSGMTRLIIGLVAGVILGLGLGLLFGYVIAPVEWTDAAPQDLRADYAAYYWSFVAESYDKNGNLELAKKQLGDWPDAKKLKAALDYAQVEASDDLDIKIDGLANRLTGQTTPVQTVAPGATPAVTPAVTPPKPAKKGSSNLTTTGGLLLLLVVACIVLLLFVRSRRNKKKAVPAETRIPDWATAAQPGETAAPSSPPLGAFVTSYSLGNDTYDDSFSIESKTGEFLGECGVGISETVGVGDPDKVSAFEVWLFDKNDIRTITKVLMSEYAYNDPALRARLATKGEAVLALPNSPFSLETASLRIDAMVTDVAYGSSSGQPNSFFERFTLELVCRERTAA